EERQEVQALAARGEPDDLIRLHQGFSEGYDQLSRSGQARAALEMLLVRLCRRPPLIPVDDLIGRLSSLEKRLGARPPTENPPPAVRDATARPVVQRPRGREARPQPTRSSPDPKDEPPAARHPEPQPAPDRAQSLSAPPSSSTSSEPA